MRLLVAVLALALALPVVADQAKNLYKKGQDAEARQDYETAYDAYKQAYELKPKELKYHTAWLRLRFLSAASHVRKGQLLRDAGRLDQALAEFQKALEIDPSSFIAQQEARRTQDLIEQAKHPGPQAAAPAEPDTLSGRAAAAEGPVELVPISQQPITLQITEDSRVVYETIGKLAGINVLFDPEYSSPRRIRIALNGVTLNEALRIVALESKTFWRPVTSNTIFVAADSPSKRKELQQSVIKTFYLSNLSQPTELMDVTNALRQILEINRIQQLPTQGAIVVRGTPDQVAMAEKLIDDFDKARPEVVVDVVVMQVSRNKLRNLGILPPPNATIQLQNPSTTSTTTTGGTTGGTGGTVTTTTPAPVTLNTLANLTASDFVVNIPPATANFLMDDTTTKIIQEPQVRALDGQKAILKIGSRIPVATGSFQPGIGGIGINPLVNTQFQYIDVGVNIEITPHIHADREVTMKVSLEISSVIGQQNIGGIQQPIIGQQKVDHDIRLKEGEINLLGGILEQTDVKEMTGIPGLGQIPFLKYFFATENVKKTDNELVFALVPHIVRMQDLSSLNMRPVDVGTGTDIELRTTPKVQPPASEAPPATSPAAQPPAAASQAPAQPTPPAPAAQPAAAAGASLRFDPSALTQAVGSTFVVNVTLAGGQDIFSVPVQLSYDPKVLELVNISDGGLLSRDGQAVALVHRDDPSSGTLQISASRPPGSGGMTGDGPVFTLTFLAKAKGSARLTITRPGARDSKMAPVPVTASEGTVVVQ